MTEKGTPMSAPTTSLDSRFSQPGATPTSWDDTLRVIETAELFWITTVHADGRPGAASKPNRPRGPPATARCRW
jgi:predicted pyridoxine 5'-phosphate oxidase superfamily flavin-nucleotide-binding protein